jgi:hypothetical protein
MIIQRFDVIVTSPDRNFVTFPLEADGGHVGLGMELNLDEAGKYPHKQAYLPHNRLADGTVHDR